MTDANKDPVLILAGPPGADVAFVRHWFLHNVYPHERVRLAALWPAFYNEFNGVTNLRTKSLTDDYLDGRAEFVILWVDAAPHIRRGRLLRPPTKMTPEDVDNLEHLLSVHETDHQAHPDSDDVDPYYLRDRADAMVWHPGLRADLVELLKTVVHHIRSGKIVTHADRKPSNLVTYRKLGPSVIKQLR